MNMERHPKIHSTEQPWQYDITTTTKPKLTIDPKGQSMAIAPLPSQNYWSALYSFGLGHCGSHFSIGFCSNPVTP